MEIYKLMVLCFMFGGEVCEDAGMSEDPGTAEVQWREIEPLMAEFVPTPKVVPSTSDVQPKPTTDCLPPLLAPAEWLLGCE